MNKPPQEPLRVGSKINIKRTDGRIHSAIVAAIDDEQRCATVEWFEQDETKGKEIDIAVIESLNPDIIILRPGQDIDMGGDLDNESLGSEIIIIKSPEKERHMNNRSGTQTQTQPKFNQLQRNPTRQSIPSLRSNNGLPSANSRYTINGHNPQSNNDDIPTETNIPTTSRQNLQQVQNSRRSNVVKEVEKLKKNREERRQRQAEEKEAKEAFLRMDPGNPHWELLNMIMEYRRALDMKPLAENDAVEDHLITVCVRKRPLNKTEKNRKEVDVITIPSKNQLIVHEPKNKVDLTKYLDNQRFRFDYAFDETCSNEMVYRYTAQPLIKTIFEGGMATCFAYGQTGAGKTHTMGGEFNGKNQDCQKGIYALASADVFKFAKSPKYRQVNLVVSASFFEIYSGNVYDLLNNKSRLRVLEDGKQQVVIVGLTEKVVSSTNEVLTLIQKGNQARTSGQTFANSNSSRSHAVFQIYLRSKNSMSKVHGKFSLIDLAGNERGADTSSSNQQTRIESSEINKSLLALKECIRALGRKGGYLPFRVSKLTQVLRDSFVGSNSRTCMIAMVSPGVNSCEYTLNTLRYADRVKELGGGDLPAAGSEQERDEENESGDLLQLSSLHENNMTPEMLNHHQVLAELQQAEENMYDTHKQVTEEIYAAHKRLVQLFHMTDNKVEYCRRMKQLVDDSVASLVRVQEVVGEYEAKVAIEEELSRKTKRK